MASQAAGPEAHLQDRRASDSREEFARTRQSRRALDWFAFFVADLQTGFGPFLAVYLTTQKWTQVDIGFVLSIGSAVALLGQMPGGWIVDAARSKRSVALWAIVGIGASAFLIATMPVFLAVTAAKLIQVAASCVLGPAMAAITLLLVGYASVGPRLGRNASFAAIGNCLAAGLMGACGFFISAQSVFYVTALLAIPAILALRGIREQDLSKPVLAPVHRQSGMPSKVGLHRLLRHRALVSLMGCLLLFHFANAAMLPLVGSDVTKRSSQWATALVAACIVGPQLVVAVISPGIGRLAQVWGRRLLLLLGFVALPVRGLLLAWTTEPFIIVIVQLLDGISAAALGVLVPLILADISRETGHFNLAQGIAGSAVGVGATGSAIGAGYLADHFGTPVAFMGLTAIAIGAVIVLLLTLPETRPTGSVADAD